MSQILRVRTKKDNKAKGVAIRKQDNKKSDLTIADVFNYAFFNIPVNRKSNGKSSNKIRDYFAR